MASDDESDSVNDNEYESLGGKSGVIFLIDTRLTMLTTDLSGTDNTGQAKFNTAISCCRSVLLNKMRAGQKDLVGVVLFGTDKPDPKTNTKHVSLLLEPNYPTVEAVKELDRLLRDEDCQEMKETYGTSDDFLLADALWYCSSLFSRSGMHLDVKRILLFTDDVDPHSSHPDRAHMARRRAKDLNQVNITLELLPMGDFDYSKFYKELLEIVNGSTDAEAVETLRELEDVLERINRCDFKSRRYSKLKWNLGNGVILGVSLYSLYQEARVQTMQPLYRATNEPLKRVTQTFDQASGELLLPYDIQDYVKVAGRQFGFTREEKQSLKKIMEPGLVLLGFKPASWANEALQCGKASFAFPEESLVKGSRELMKALVERCAARQKVALCCITPRNGSLTKYVCLLPSQETYSDNKQATPCGFHVIPLPFYNETREQTFEPSREVDEETLDIAKKLIKKLKFEYTPGKFQNPKLEKFWTHLEALALDYDKPEIPIDSTMPVVEDQTARLAELTTEFNEACGLSKVSSTSRKRTAKASGSTVAAKKQRDANSIDITNDIDAAVATKKVDKFTVVQLKEYLTLHNQSVSGLKKADLVKAVYQLKES